MNTSNNGVITKAMLTNCDFETRSVLTVHFNKLDSAQLCRWDQAKLKFSNSKKKRKETN